MIAAPAVLDEARLAQSRRAQGLAAVTRSRHDSVPQRLFASLIMALIAASVTGGVWPYAWFAGIVVINIVDRVVCRRTLARCESGAPPDRVGALAVWVAFQTSYGAAFAAMLWFTHYAPAQTLAAIYLCGGAAAAAAILRSSKPMAIAGIAPPFATLIVLPLIDFLFAGGRNPYLLLPIVGALLLLGFGFSLWRSLLESDAAQIRAEAAAMRERQAAAAAASAKTDMIKRMNDELRTPMQALVGAAEHLRRAASTPEARAHIAMLAQAGEVLKLVLDDLSDLDRLENGQMRIEPAPANPIEIIRSVASAFRTAAQDKHLEFFLDLGDAPAAVEIDARRVRQVLFNLVANAVRYTAHGGVRLSLAARSAETPGRVRLAFSVADTGAGMSRSQLARIFGRGRLCAEGEGPGLGLAISLRLARLMGGTIQAKSELGEGSVFTLVLETPVATARSAA